MGEFTTMRFLVSLASILAMAAVATARPQNILVESVQLRESEWNKRWNQPGRFLTLPYYGGAKGQFLQIARDSNGETLGQRILPAGSIEAQQLTESQNQVSGVYSQQFNDNLRNIQVSAQRLVDLQKKSTKTGQLKAEDQKVYATHLALLGESATRLAKLGENGDYDLARLFITKNGIDDSKKTDKQDFGEDEEDVGEEPVDPVMNSPEEDDSIQIGPAPDSASVAEAKPIGVAIVGDGGVASSKPVATAVVGPGGLAIARPVATAIAGVDPNTVGFGTKFPVVAKTPAPAPARSPIPAAASADFLQAASLYPVQQYLAAPQYYVHPHFDQLYPVELTIE